MITGNKSERKSKPPPVKRQLYVPKSPATESSNNSRYNLEPSSHLLTESSFTPQPFTPFGTPKTLSNSIPNSERKDSTKPSRRRRKPKPNFTPIAESGESKSHPRVSHNKASSSSIPIKRLGRRNSFNAKRENGAVTPLVSKSFPPVPSSAPQLRKRNENNRNSNMDTQSTKKRRPRRRREHTSNEELSTPLSKQRNVKEGVQKVRSAPKKTRKSKKKTFEPYMSLSDVMKELEAGTLVKGKIRVNGHNRTEAYVTVPGMEKDIFIEGVFNRNRALEGDTVAVRILDKSLWKVMKSNNEEEAKNDISALDNKADELAEVFPSSPSTTTPLVLEKLAEIPDSDEDEDESEEEEDNEPESKLEDEGQVFKLDEHKEATTATTQHNDDEATTHVDEEEDEDESSEDEEEGEDEDEEGSEDDTEDVHTEIILTHELQSLSLKDTKTEEEVKVSVTVTMATEITTTPQPSQQPQATQTQQQEPELQPAGKVVCVLSKPIADEHIGFLKPADGKKVREDDRVALFVPVDTKSPKMIIPISQIPEFYKNSSVYDNKLVVAKLISWKEDSYLPLGKYQCVLGECGEINTETEALLRSNGVDFRDFSAEIMDSLPKGIFQIPEEELRSRRDLRHVRLFSIDPPTAKDLDDTLSIRKLEDGNFEVGVHIADVSYFVTPGSQLDKEASQRSTTVYLVQKAVPMLPHILCENLCSLNPGVDRLAFSVMWKLSPSGEVLDEWFGRSVIRSCSKLTYNVAQLIIEGHIKRHWSDWQESDLEKLYPELGPIGNHSIPEIVDDILNLHKIATKLRSDRFANGALSLNNVKLYFTLDSQGNPTAALPYVTREANHLVEEFMLLANMRVALKIAKSFPDTALLRNHVPPLPRKLDSFSKFCKSLGYEVDTSSGKALGSFLSDLKQNSTPATFQAIQLLATKPMQLAKYFCTGDLDMSQWHHYALNVDYYTHFTSPIRRYPDIIVHRLLQGAIYLDNPTEIREHKTFFATLPTTESLTAICEHCNEKKLNSRKAQDASINLYMCLLLKQNNNGKAEDAVVMSVGEKFISVVLPYYADEKRVYLEDLDIASFQYTAETKSLVLEWPAVPGDKEAKPTIAQTLTTLSPIKVKLTTKPNKFPMDIRVTMLHPSTL